MDIRYNMKYRYIIMGIIILILSQISSSQSVDPPISAGLVADYDASKMVGYSDNDPIENMSDWSGTNNHAIQSTEAYRATYKEAIGDYSKVGFALSGAQYYDAVFNLNSPDTTVYMIGMTSTTSTGDGPMVAINTGGYCGTIWRYSSNTYHPIAAASWSIGSYIAANSWYSVVNVFDTGKSQLYVNRTRLVNAAGTPSVGEVSLFRRNDGANEEFKGYAQQILIYDDAHTETQINQTLDWLETKWFSATTTTTTTTTTTIKSGFRIDSGGWIINSGGWIIL